MHRKYGVAVVAACPFTQPRGTPIRVFRMAEGLARRGHEVHVITYHVGDDPGDVPFRIHRTPELSTYRRLAPGPTYQKLFVLDVLLAVKLRHVLREYDIELIHAHHYEGFLTALIANRGIGLPLIFDSHAFLETELPFYGLGLAKGIKRRIGMKLDRSVPGLATHVIATSAAMRERLLADRRIAPENVTVVAGGVDIGRFAESAGTRSEVGRADDPHVLIYAGNLAAFQGVDLMLKAFAIICEHRQDVRLKLVTNSSTAKHEQLARGLGIHDRIDFVDVAFEQLPAHLRSATVAVNPRVQLDGYPQKLLNYMAAALPIVSFAGSGALLDDGKTGLLVPNGDVAALARSIESLLDDPARAQYLGENAFRKVQSEFSWEAGVEIIEGVYDRLVTG